MVVPDIGAFVVRLLARPLVLVFGFEETPAELRRETRSTPSSTSEALQAGVVRVPAWAIIGLLMLLPGIVVSLAESAITTEVAEVAHILIEAALVTSFVIAVIEAIKVGIAHFSKDRELAVAARWYRAAVVPGNADVLVAILLVASGHLVGG